MHEENKLSTAEKMAIIGAGVIFLCTARKSSRFKPFKLAIGGILLYQGLKIVAYAH
ncbi:hypothetical protein [Albibacterium profundi]|uniref:Uncharacterized protein n=1 Tax=Albibacterium profundi TaxID=3134906 RepID=A0ABV5CI87_9SPHI